MCTIHRLPTWTRSIESPGAVNGQLAKQIVLLSFRRRVKDNRIVGRMSGESATLLNEYPTRVRVAGTRDMFTLSSGQSTGCGSTSSSARSKIRPASDVVGKIVTFLQHRRVNFMHGHSAGRSDLTFVTNAYRQRGQTQQAALRACTYL